jgi:hypothetical protein
MRLAVLVALILVVCGCGAHAQTTNAGTRLYVPGPDGPPRYEPTGDVYVSPDGADQWDIDHWVSYGGATGSASGRQSVNNCTPSCVAGHHSTATVTVVPREDRLRRADRDPDVERVGHTHRQWSRPDGLLRVRRLSSGALVSHAKSQGREHPAAETLLRFRRSTQGAKDRKCA